MDRLGEELGCSRVDVIRTAIHLLRQPENADYRADRRAENVALAFRDRLVRDLGGDARLEFELRGDGGVDATIGGGGLPEYAGVHWRPKEGRVHVDLFEPETDVAIANVAILDHNPGSRTSILLGGLDPYGPDGRATVRYRRELAAREREDDN